MKINTLIVLIGLVRGEMIWGITGMFLSIPVIAIFKVIFDRINGLNLGTFCREKMTRPQS